jgi:hypothetical protein
VKLEIGERYEGIPGVLLGGYVAGIAARDLGPSVTVTLAMAVPPGSTITLERNGSGGVLRAGDELAATAVPSPFETTAPPAVGPREAATASERYPGLQPPFLSELFHLRTEPRGW